MIFLDITLEQSAFEIRNLSANIEASAMFGGGKNREVAAGRGRGSVLVLGSVDEFVTVERNQRRGSPDGVTCSSSRIWSGKRPPPCGIKCHMVYEGCR